MGRIMNKQEFINLLTFHMNYQGAYHNHKETIIWASIASFTAVIAFILQFAGGPNSEKSTNLLVSTMFLIIIITIITLLFVTQQFNHKFDAAVRVRILNEEIWKVAGNKNWMICNDLVPNTVEEKDFFPPYLQQKIKTQKLTSIKEGWEGKTNHCLSLMYIIFLGAGAFIFVLWGYCLR